MPVGTDGTAAGGLGVADAPDVAAGVPEAPGVGVALPVEQAPTRIITTAAMTPELHSLLAIEKIPPPTNDLNDRFAPLGRGQIIHRQQESRGSYRSPTPSRSGKPMRWRAMAAAPRAPGASLG